ncbi:hypothetical protein ACFXKG_37530 [Streptomyces sp. NPDC059255]|uniref:hypothetical protein n=1 Tax=unclassified Streptomyces TaxID=2593676 RepID=UPI00368BF249
MTTTTTFAKIILAPREKQVVEGLGDGSTLHEVALGLKIRESTAAGYLRLAKRKLHGTSENAAMLAVAYATESIAPPETLDSEELSVPREQLDLVPLIAQGMRGPEMAAELKRHLDLVRRDGRRLMTNLRARNPAHITTRAWQYRFLTAEQVFAWLP